MHVSHYGSVYKQLLRLIPHRYSSYQLRNRSVCPTLLQTRRNNHNTRRPMLSTVREWWWWSGLFRGVLSFTNLQRRTRAGSPGWRVLPCVCPCDPRLFCSVLSFSGMWRRRAAGGTGRRVLSKMRSPTSRLFYCPVLAAGLWRRRGTRGTRRRMLSKMCAGLSQLFCHNLLEAGVRWRRAPRRSGGRMLSKMSTDRRGMWDWRTGVFHLCLAVPQVMWSQSDNNLSGCVHRGLCLSSRSGHRQRQQEMCRPRRLSKTWYVVIVVIIVIKATFNTKRLSLLINHAVRVQSCKCKCTQWTCTMEPKLTN